MKKFLVFLGILFLVSNCKSKKIAISDTENRMIEVSPNEVETFKKDRAYALGYQLLDACNTSKFKPYTKEEATDQVIRNATLSRISETCRKINFRNGRFLGLQLTTISFNKNSKEYLFKYAIEYEKKYFKRELTVVIDDDNKVSAIYTKEQKPKPM